MMINKCLYFVVVVVFCVFVLFCLFVCLFVFSARYFEQHFILLGVTKAFSFIRKKYVIVAWNYAKGPDST